jgi:tripartite-type tricarboxylate transporter receptor subunit TctC
MKPTLYRIMCVLSILGLGANANTYAQSDYPVKSIRLLVPFPPGGSTDIVGRIMAQRLSERMGQQVIVENRGGAGGTIGSDIAARASADGYNLLLASTSTLAVAPAAYPKLKYDPIRDFAPISLIGVTPYLLVVNPSVAATDLKALVALAKREPGKLNYASAGNGTTTHLAMEMLKDAAGIDLQHVPYKGNGEADTAIVAGQIQAVFGSMPALLGHAKTGKLRPLAVGSAKRSPVLPDVPTVAELGYPGFEVSLWLGVVAPAGTPKPILDRLEREIRAVGAMPEYRDALSKNGADAVTNTQAEFANAISGDVARYQRVVKSANLKFD